MYICGAKTEKGRKCKRKVTRKGSKCFQHTLRNKRKKNVSWKNKVKVRYVPKSKEERYGFHLIERFAYDHDRSMQERFDDCAVFMGEKYGIWESSDFIDYINEKRYQNIPIKEQKWVIECAAFLDYF